MPPVSSMTTPLCVFRNDIEILDLKKKDLELF